jgi:hypothetical protein
MKHLRSGHCFPESCVSQEPRFRQCRSEKTHGVLLRDKSDAARLLRPSVSTNASMIDVTCVCRGYYMRVLQTSRSKYRFLSSTLLFLRKRFLTQTMCRWVHPWVSLQGTKPFGNPCSIPDVQQRRSLHGVNEAYIWCSTVAVFCAQHNAEQVELVRPR